MKKIKLKLVALAKSESSPNNYSLILEDVNHTLRIPITVGPFEAQAIALHLEQMQTTRPMTHDLFKNTIEAFGGQLREIFIHEITDSAFHCQMTYQTPDNIIEVDARTSDAIALAIRFEAPIYISDSIIEKVGFPIKPEAQLSADNRPLEEYSVSELEQLLEKRLANEEYKSAAEIRDLIKQKKGEEG